MELSKKDLANIKYLQNEPKDCQLKFKVLAAITITFAISSAYAVSSSLILSSNAYAVANAEQDNLISPERAEYMLLFEHGEEITDYDMQ